MIYMVRFKEKTKYTLQELSKYVTFQKELIKKAEGKNWNFAAEKEICGEEREILLAVFSKDGSICIWVTTYDPEIVEEERNAGREVLQAELWYGKKKTKTGVDYGMEIEKCLPLKANIVSTEVEKCLSVY